jgi:hypothetical protein
MAWRVGLIEDGVTSCWVLRSGFEQEPIIMASLYRLTATPKTEKPL